MKLVDAHTHLNYEEFSESDLKERIESIKASDIRFIVNAGDNLASSKLAIAQAEANDFCYAAIGIHPEYASTYSSSDLESIKELCSHPKVLAIGEIGLDFHYGRENSSEQIELFRRQIRIANEARLPIMVHSRDADQLTMDILNSEGAFSKSRTSFWPHRLIGSDSCPDARVQLHCFSGSLELALQYIKLGATLSMGGPITFKSNKRGVNVVRGIPIECLMTETDAPYLTPEPHRGEKNRSEYVYYVCAKIAEIKEMSIVDTAEILYANACRFFNIGE